MYRGRLLASVCALGLIVAAPAFAQAPVAPHPPTKGHVMKRGHHVKGPVHAMRSHHKAGRRMGMTRAGMGRSDTSQNAAVDQLNAQSLAAARSGTPFMGSSSGAPAPAPAHSGPPAGNTKM